MGKLALCAALLAGPWVAPAQVVVPELRLENVRPGPSLLGPPPPGQPTSTNAPGAPAKTATPEEQRLQLLLALTFDRSAPSILQARAKALRASPVSTNEAEIFQLAIVSGDWSGAGALLQRLPPEQAARVYTHVLKELQKPPAKTPAPAGGPPGMPPQPGGPSIPMAATLFPDDVLALADMAPAKIAHDQLQMLGQLLNRSLANGTFIEPFITRLEAGTQYLGGKDPEKRERAAQLLVSAGRLVEAGRFLPEIPKADVAALDLQARHLIALGREDQNKEALRKAWEINQSILSLTNAPATNRETALRRSFELMPLVQKQLGTNWLRDSFAKNPQDGMVILAAISDLILADAASRDFEKRRNSLELQKQVVETLLAVTRERVELWQTALDLLAAGWAQEADYAKARHQGRPQFPMRQFDPFGNPIYYGGPNMQYNNPNELQPIPVDRLLLTAPTAPWLERLSPSLLPRLQMVLADLHTRVNDYPAALAYIERLAKEHPKRALALANEVMRGWARSHNPYPNQQFQNYGPYGPVYYGMGSPYGSAPPGTSLTRAMQVRNIKEISGLLDRFRALGLPALNEKALVEAFSAAHSQAEVFRFEDIELVFGKIDELPGELLAELLQTMRQRLAAQWRNPRLQQQAKTQRTDKQIDAEVLRGYEVVMGLIERALQKNPQSWQLHLAQGAVLFDWEEFQYGKKVDLAVYVEKRDRAFSDFKRAAELYAAKSPTTDEKEETVQVYQQWFNANLGASDLAYVTRQQEPSTNTLAQIRGALLELPGDAAERHWKLLAKSLNDSVNTLKPELKPRYLRAAVQLLGAHPDAGEIRKLAAYYDDLLGEIALEVRIDGDATVGHTQPFGVFVALRHTTAVERESGGFARYLRNQKNNQMYYYNPYGQQPRNFIEEFEKQVREKLTDTFDIKVITFHDDKVESRGIGRDGWRETPLAYFLVQAKDASVDRLPALHMDLDFMDQRGSVVLPVESQTVLLDARPVRGEPRPVRDLELTQILDDRELAQQKLALEIKVTAKGLVPALPELLELKFAGFKVDETADAGVSVTQLSTEGDAVAPVSERIWNLKLSPVAGQTAPATFRFPPSARPGAKLVFKRFVDADLVEVKPEVALAGFALRPQARWPWYVLGAVLVVGGAVVARVITRKRAGAVETSELYQLPPEITPFSILTFLRKMQQDDRLRLTTSNREELQRTIHQLEGYFFSRARNGDPAPDLAAIGQNWLSRVRAELPLRRDS